MAPLCADPRQIVIALEPKRRIELLKLVDDIILSMTAELQAKPEELGSVSMESSIHEEQSSDEKPKDPSQTQVQHRETANIEPQSDKSSGSITLFDADEPVEKGATGGNSTAKGKFNPSNPFKNVKIGVPWKNNPNAPSKATRRAEQVQAAAVKYLKEWQKEFMPRLEEIVRVEDNDKIIAERKNRGSTGKPEDETIANRTHVTQDGTEIDAAEDLMFLQELYTPVPTSLTDLSSNDRREILSCVLLLLLSTGKYSGHSRAMMMHLASSLGLTQTFLNNEEAEIAKSLMESSTADDNQKESMSAEAEAAKRRQENKFSRFWKVGLASVAGATIIGVTGGLAAPLVAGAVGGILGGVGLGGVASFLGIFWMNGALVGALFGAYGAKMTGTMMDKYAKEVEDFRFIPLNGQDMEAGKASGTQTPEHPNQEIQEKVPDKEDFKDRRLRVTIGVNGWLNSEDDVTKPWEALSSNSEVFALRYEMKTLLSLGTALNDLVHSFAWQAFKSEIIKRTVLATLWAALWPIQVVAMASNVDNPFNHASNRSKKAGRLLADALINKVQGERPVTLVGYSLGAVAIHSCLQSLAERRAFGLVDTVVIIGTPAPSDAAHWRTLHTVVSGKIFNVYSENDMVLGFVYRMHSLALGVAGLQAIEGVGGVENLNLSDSVSGHLRYPTLLGKILHRCGFIGIKTTDDEIEKDDVIKMKDEYAAGQIVDLDEKEGAKKADETSQHQEGVTTASQDLRDMSLSNNGKTEKEVNPPLPKRPVPARKPVAQQEGLISFDEPDIAEPQNAGGKRDEVATKGSDHMKPLTPEPKKDKDDEEEHYTPITMMDSSP